MRKIELFLRGETWLHIVTMFFCMTILIQVALFFGFYLPIWSLIILTILVALGWEIIWKISTKKPIDIIDIVGTCIGGILAIIIIKII